MAKSAEEDGGGLAAEPFSTWFVFDSPTFGRALRYTFADKRLGRAVFTNALFLVIAIGIVQEIFSRGGLGLASEKLSFGRAAFLALCVVETGIVSLLGPISFSHLFNAERREDCFDQVVATGCSPLRIILGRYAAALAFLGVTVGSALPFFIFASVVLKGATLGEALGFYGLLGLYAATTCGATAAATVALEDAAFPAVAGGLFALTSGAAGLSPATIPFLGAWAPYRFVTVELAPVIRSLGLGEFLAPTFFGDPVPAPVVSVVLYLALLVLSFAYVAVGPDLEMGEGLDSFSSVTLKRGAEASRGRRGLAATLLRTVQLRFLYDNLGPRTMALRGFVRASATVAIFALAHVFALGMLWPRVVPKSFADMKARTIEPYLGFAALSLGLIALASAGSRSSVLARESVLKLGPIRIGRFSALFATFAFAVVFPPLLFRWASLRAGLPLDGQDAERLLAFWGVCSLYATFVFGVGLVFAMATTNQYSAMGGALLVLVFGNLLPLGWIPLFTSNVVTEASAKLLDVSPALAGWAVLDPGETFTLTQIRDEQTFAYQHAPSWQPFAYVHAPLAVLAILVGLVLERRDARTRRRIPAKAVAAAVALLAMLAWPAAARAQDAAPLAIECDLGFAGRAPNDGFMPLFVKVENRGDRDVKVDLVLREAPRDGQTQGNVLAKVDAVEVPRGTTKRVPAVVAADGLAHVAGILVEATSEDGTVLAQTSPKAIEPLRKDRLLVVLDKRGALPFAEPGNGLRSLEATAVRRGRGQPPVQEASWSVAFVSRTEDLPVSAHGWAGVGAVIVGDLELERWDEPAARALVGWLGRGGDLIVIVGDRGRALRESRLGKLLANAIAPVADAAPRSNVALEPLADRLGEHGLELPAAVAAFAPPGDEDRLVEGTADAPLAVRRSAAAGRLTLVAYDPWRPPLLHREGTAHLFEHLLSRGPRYAPRTDVLFNELRELRVQPARIGPAFGLLVLYALFVGPGIYFALRPKKRGLLAWILIPVFTLVFSALTPLYRLVLARTESALVTASILETTAGDPWELETADSLIFSGGVEVHDLAVRGDDVTAATILPARGFRGGRPRVGVALGAELKPGVLGFPLEVPLWGARYVSVERLNRSTRAPRIRGRILLRARTTEIELENEGSLPLDDAVVVFPEFLGGGAHAMAHSFRAIDRGEKVHVVAAGRPVAALAKDTAQKDLAQTIAQKLVQERAARRVTEVGERQEAVLVAKLPEAGPALNGEPALRLRANAQVLLARVPFVFADRVPLSVSTSVRDVHEAAAVGSTSGGKVAWTAETRISLPPGAGLGRKPIRVRVEVVPTGAPLRELALAWWDATNGRWERLVLDAPGTERDFHDRRALVPLPRPADAVDASNTILVRQTFELPAGSTGTTALADVDATVEWAE